MALSFPLAFPSSPKPRKVDIRARSVVGKSVSPFTLTAQTYTQQGQQWMARIEMPPMARADAEAFAAFMLALNGVSGTFTMRGDAINSAPRGTWAGTPLINGAHAAGVTTLTMDGFSAGATVKAGDWFQTGTGANTHLHKVVQDATASGGGAATLEIYPRLRAALADNAALTTSAPEGLWRLASNEMSWSIELAELYGITLDVEEAL